jgi:hypothetical protein
MMSQMKGDEEKNYVPIAVLFFYFIAPLCFPRIFYTSVVSTGTTNDSECYGVSLLFLSLCSPEERARHAQPKEEKKS